jgi:hypothetical protein
MRKNYIELPMGEIPELKESFYDEASRWSLLRPANKNYSNKTPDVLNSQSYKNLHKAEKLGDSSKRQESSRASLQQDDDREDHLFLYSQGESGATFNRTDNDQSFLTSRDDQRPAKESHNESTPPSFEALKELSAS